MDNKTRNRLWGLNQFLSDLYEEDFLVSRVLLDSGFEKETIEDIRTKHLDEYIYTVSNKIIECITIKWSKKLAEIIEFFYCLDGEWPRQNQNTDNDFEVSKGYLPRQRHQAIIWLRKPNRRQIIWDIFISSANRLLIDNNPDFSKQMKGDYRLILIKQSAERMKNRARNSHKESLERRKIRTRRSYKPYKNKERIAWERRQDQLLNKALKKSRDSVPARIIISKGPRDRKMYNPWVGPDRDIRNWW